MEVINSNTDSIDLKSTIKYSNSKNVGATPFDLLYEELAQPNSPIPINYHQTLENLCDKNWEQRQQALLKLLDGIPNDDVVLYTKGVRECVRLVTLNLSHGVLAIQRLAFDVLVATMRYTKYPEDVINDVIYYGIDNTTTDTNLSQSTIHIVPTLLRHLKQRTSSISHKLLSVVIASLSRRMVQITHQRQVMSSMQKIEKLVGPSIFQHFLETYFPQVKRDFDVLCRVYTGASEDYSDISEVSETEPESLFPLDDIKSIDGGDENTLITVGEMETENNAGGDEEWWSEDADVDGDIATKNAVIMKVYDEEGNEVRRSSSSKRVTFGGEIVKIRTPDSEGTVTANNTEADEQLPEQKETGIEPAANSLQQISNDGSSDSNSGGSVSNESGSSNSRIPLPINPALNKPSHPKLKFQPFTQQQPTKELLNTGGSSGKSTCKDQDLLLDIPNYDGESLGSSSSDSSPTYAGVNDRQSMVALMNNAIQDLHKMKINDKIVLENLFKKDDWRYYISATERLSQILMQPFCLQNISSSMENGGGGISLLSYICNSLMESENSKVICSSLRVSHLLCQAMQSSSLGQHLPVLIPTFCSHLNCSNDYVVRLESVEILKMLMQKFTPQKVVNILFSQKCFYSKSSKMRENALLCLMYALITFPSTEFKVEEITEKLMNHGVHENKKRVRQALLDTLSILGQLIPKSKFHTIVETANTEFFKKAVSARLSRRQLPTVSQSGLILYAFQINSNTVYGADIEWIMSGKGSLSDNYNKSIAQFNYIANNDIPSPLKSKSRWNSKYYKGGTRNAPIEVEIKAFLRDEDQLLRGGSVEGLYPVNRMNTKVGSRFSADWTDQTSDEFFGTSFDYKLRSNSNNSDSSSYDSSYSSEQNLPRLTRTYESNSNNNNGNSLFQNRPSISEEKLHRLSSWSKKPSKLPLKLDQDTSHKLSDYYDYSNVSCSLPMLNFKKEKFFKNHHVTKKYFSSNKNINRWCQGQEESKLIISENNVEEKQIQDKNKEKYNAYRNKEIVNNNNNIQKGDNAVEQKITSNSNEVSKDRNETDSAKLVASKCDSVPNASNEGIETLDKPKKILERKAGVKLKRSLTKEIKMPQNTFILNPKDIAPFEHPKDALQKTILQFESNEWETVINALQSVIRLATHHAKQFAPALHPYVIAVAKEVGNLRSQVARAAFLSAESIFKHIPKISDQDIEELSHALFLRTADTNKFLREDSIKSLNVMIDNIKFSKSVTLLTQRAANCPNALIRVSTAKLLHRLILNNGPQKILALNKEKKDIVINTIVKFLMDGNLATRNEGKEIFQVLLKEKKMVMTLSETLPNSVIASINKSISRC